MPNEPKGSVVFIFFIAHSDKKTLIAFIILANRIFIDFSNPVAAIVFYHLSQMKYIT